MRRRILARLQLARGQPSPDLHRPLAHLGEVGEAIEAAHRLGHARVAGEALPVPIEEVEG